MFTMQYFVRNLAFLCGVSVANVAEEGRAGREIVYPEAFEAVGELDPGSAT